MCDIEGEQPQVQCTAKEGIRITIVYGEGNQKLCSTLKRTKKVDEICFIYFCSKRTWRYVSPALIPPLTAVYIYRRGVI